MANDEDRGRTASGYRSGTWRGNLETVPDATSWTCFFCGEYVAGREQEWRMVSQHGQHMAWVRVCNACNVPTFFGIDGRPVPEGPYGRTLKKAPESNRRVYDEARRCCSVGAYSAAVLLCRKLIVHIAHDLQPEELKGKRQNFAQYIDWLNKEGYIPPNGKGWVTRLKDRGNEENHEIVVATREDAERSMILSYAPLLWNYELQAP